MNLLFFQVRLFTVRVRLKLRASVALSPVFSTTAQYGHFHPDFPWELEDLSAQLFQAVADGSRQKPREFDTSAF